MAPWDFRFVFLLVISQADTIGFYLFSVILRRLYLLF